MVAGMEERLIFPTLLGRFQMWNILRRGTMSRCLRAYRTKIGARFHHTVKRSRVTFELIKEFMWKELGCWRLETGSATA